MPTHTIPIENIRIAMTPKPASSLMCTAVGSRATQSTNGRRNVGNGPRSLVVSEDGRVASALVDMIPPLLTVSVARGHLVPSPGATLGRGRPVDLVMPQV